MSVRSLEYKILPGSGMNLWVHQGRRSHKQDKRDSEVSDDNTTTYFWRRVMQTLRTRFYNVESNIADGDEGVENVIRDMKDRYG
jgi:hypothetical protein